MKNVYELKPAKVLKVIKENSITNTVLFELKDQKNFKFLAGQFMQIGIPGFGECPISISSNPKDSSKQFSLTIRSVGELTEKLNAMKKGDTVMVRGPFGNGFPEVDRNLIIVGGGCGFIPLRGVFQDNKNRKDIKIQVFVGCATQDSLVFRNDLKNIKEKHSLHLILEKEKFSGYSTQTGFVTELLKKKKLLNKAMVFVCGPAAMYPFVLKELLAKGVDSKDIYLSLEKRMHCGVGLCQHCAVGTKYVCKDGPVFSYEFLKESNYLK